MTRTPNIEKALMHLAAAAVEVDLGMSANSWLQGQEPHPAWWVYRDAAVAIRRAERLLRGAMPPSSLLDAIDVLITASDELQRKSEAAQALREEAATSSSDSAPDTPLPGGLL